MILHKCLNFLSSLGSDADDEEASADDSSVTSTNPLGVRLSDGRDVLDLMLTVRVTLISNYKPDVYTDFSLHFCYIVDTQCL